MLESDAGHRVLLDPHLVGSPAFAIPASPVALDALGSVHLVLVTHAAFDHLGETASALERWPEAELVCGLDVAYLIERAGIERGRIHPVAQGSGFQIGDVSVRALDARHISWTVVEGSPVAGVALSFIVRDESHCVFHSGDTALTMDHELFGRLHRPDIALVGIGGSLVNGHQVAEVTPAEAALMVKFLASSVAIPMHYRHQEEATAFASEVAAASPRTTTRLMAPGEALTSRDPVLTRSGERIRPPRT